MNKTAFVTFSSSALLDSSILDYQKFIKIIEKDCDLAIKHRWFDKNEKRAPEEIFPEAIQAIQEADVVIADGTIPSVGIGQQIAYALQKRIPVYVCIHENSKNENFFLKGTQSRLLKIVHYKSLDELCEKLCEKTQDITAVPKLQKFNFLATEQLKRALKIESEKRGISQSEMLRQIFETWADNQNK